MDLLLYLNIVSLPRYLDRTDDPCLANLHVLTRFEDFEQDLFEIATGLTLDTIGQTSMSHLEVGQRDVFHHALITNQRSRQQNLVRPEAFHALVDELGNLFERTNLHAHFKENGVLELATKLSFNSLHEGLAVLFSVVLIELLQILGRSSTEKFEQSLLVGSDPAPRATNTILVL